MFVVLSGDMEGQLLSRNHLYTTQYYAAYSAMLKTTRDPGLMYLVKLLVFC